MADTFIPVPKVDGVNGYADPEGVPQVNTPAAVTALKNCTPLHVFAVIRL